MRTHVISAALALLPVVAAAAPFCVVDNSGREDCEFYSMDSCRDSARFRGGACLYKPETRPGTTDSNPWDWGSAVQRGLESGRQKRQERELHDLEVQRRQAEIAEIRAKTSTIRPASAFDADRAKWRSDCDFLYRYASTLKDKGDDVRGRATWEDFKDCRAKYVQKWPDGKGEFGPD